MGRRPYCGHCGCVIPREGGYCQSCRNDYGYENDECTCFEDRPENCLSKLEHYCCCSDAIYTTCKALCDQGEINDQCIAENHDL